MFERQKKVVTRMAPSPTGSLHIGTARTALFNFLFARHSGGTFIMRSEDTDTTRSKKEFEEEILSGLEWLGMSWDALYRQSERTEIYSGYLDKLIRGGSAFVSKEPSKDNPGEMTEVIRFKNPNKTIVFEDLIRGEITFDTTELGDFVIARSRTDALYHLAVVIDDHEMGVTHVIRGEDHISNTPRQILLQEAIGADRPEYAHLPLLLAPDRSKLSKRHGAVSLNEYIADGYLPNALVNYLAFLGWSPGTDQELFSLRELIEDFDINGVQKGGAIFNIEKLNWFNREHLKSLTKRQLFTLIQERLPDRVKKLPQYSQKRLEYLLSTIIERISVPKEVTELAETGEYDFAFARPSLDVNMLKWKEDTSPREALPRLQRVAEIISTIQEDASAEDIKARIWEYAEETGKGKVLWPLRVALTGRERSPDPFTVIYVIGSGEAYRRLRNACDTILSA